MDEATQDVDELQALRRVLRNMYYDDALVGSNQIYYFHGRRVHEYTTTKGITLAVKLMSFYNDAEFDASRSEAAMMHYAATHGVLAPKVHGVYDIVTTRPSEPIAVAMVSGRVPSSRLADVWPDVDESTRSSLKEQLRHQIKQMRACTSRSIGRLAGTATCNVYDRLPTTYCGPFKDEELFEEWCLARVPIDFLGLQRKQWAKWLEKERHKSGNGKFVLTHGDLTPRNIIVKDGMITGIVDWERSGFFPEYAEYAFAMKLGHEIEEWWLPVLKEVLQPCSSKRLKFTSLVEDRDW